METDEPLRVLRRNPLDIVVSGMSSDAHTWNLVYLQLLLEEQGHRVTNLGACVPEPDLVAWCRAACPDLVVLSSVNGHGVQDGVRAIRALRGCAGLAATPIVIGGKLDTVGGRSTATADRLIAAGFDAVFQDDAAIGAFRSFVATLPRRAAKLVGA